MEDFTLIKCPSCGSSVIETESENISQCSHCGSKLLIKSDTPSKQTKVNTMLIGSLLVVLSLTLLGLYLSNSDKQPVEAQARIELPKIGVPNVKLNLPKVNAKAMTVVTEDLINKKALDVPKISIVNQVAGKTSSEGLFWIMTIRNDGIEASVRNGVVASLFDSNNKRIEEQKGYAQLATLEPGQETELLVYIAKPPQQEFRLEMIGHGFFPKYSQPNQEIVEVLDFTIKSKYNNSTMVDIIGDVKNTHEFQIDFVKVVAVAKDKDGNSIGLANGFVTHSSLTANSQSGFKVSAGTFVSGQVSEWKLWAFGRKHTKEL